MFCYLLSLSKKTNCHDHQCAAWVHTRNSLHVRSAAPIAQYKRLALMVTVVFSGNHNRDAQDFKLEDVMVEKRWFLQKKTAPPIEGGALLNRGKITRIAVIASFNCTIRYLS